MFKLKILSSLDVTFYECGFMHRFIIPRGHTNSSYLLLGSVTWVYTWKRIPNAQRTIFEHLHLTAAPESKDISGTDGRCDFRGGRARFGKSHAYAGSCRPRDRNSLSDSASRGRAAATHTLLPHSTLTHLLDICPSHT